MQMERPQNNMMGALTSMIMEHWYGVENEVSNNDSIVLMNLKCKNTSQYQDFRRDWVQRIYEANDCKKLL